MKNILYLFLILFQFIFSFDINNSNSEDWNQLSKYLSTEKIQLIQNYLIEIGEINNIYELENIDGITILDIQILKLQKPFTVKTNDQSQYQVKNISEFTISASPAQRSKNKE